MKHKLFQALLISAFICGGAALASAQESAARTPQPSASQASASSRTPARTSADETFELNISERRITEKNFVASTSVEAGDESAHGLRLRIGVGVGAEQIDVLLRNVHGQVRFRGTLERVLELLNSRRPPESTP